MKTIVVALLLTAAATAANAQKLRPFADPATQTFTATLSNNTPLVFGMGVEDAQRALGTPFTHVSGRRGNEIFLTFRDLGGSGLFPHHDRLYLQFRKGRLEGRLGRELDVAIEHDPEKCEAVFREDHAQNMRRPHHR